MNPSLASSRRDLLKGSVVVAAVAAVGAVDAVAKEPVPEGLAARAEVERRLNAQRDAWNRGDLEGFCAAYADDAVFLSPSGVTRGRAEVQARYQKKYGGKPETMGTLSFEPLDVRASSSCVSLAMRWKLVFKDKPEATGLTLIAWVKLNDEWKLAQDASM